MTDLLNRIKTRVKPLNASEQTYSELKDSSVIDEEKLKYYTATQWQLIWWRFKRHKLALIGSAILTIFFIMAIFAEIIAPYSMTSRDTDYLLAPPQKVHFRNSDGDITLIPHVYGVKSVRNMETLRMGFEEVPEEAKALRLFVKGESYKLLGFIPSSIHLFGVKGGYFHVFGTDEMGRDLFSRLVYATRTSLSIGVLGLFIAFVLGLMIGGISGYFGGWIDNMIQRFIEFVRSIPTLPLWMSLAAAMPREWSAMKVYFIITIILGLVGWTSLARRIRSKLLSLRDEDFITAAKIMGNSDARIIWRHMLPSFTSYIIVDLTLSFPYMILSETALSFIGLGLRPPVTSWGVLLKASQNVRSIAQSPWLFIPAIFVILAVLAFSFVGDGMRDAADPYANN